MNSLVGLVLFLFVSSAICTNYCRKDLCKPNKRHIGCRNYGKWASGCGSNPKMIEFSEDDKQFILDVHNIDRQAIASGKIEPYEPAAGMKAVKWNDELAQLAALTAKTCEFKHDECRNTDTHPHAGQNIAYTSSNKQFIKFREAYQELHNDWFLEHKHCDMKIIKNYAITTGEVIGHFTQLVRDTVNELGCACSNYVKNGEKTVLIVCNYSYTNMLKQPIYVHGKPQCAKFSDKYDALCVDK